MAKFKTITKAAFEKARKTGAAQPHAIGVRYNSRKGRIEVELDTGIDFSFDPKMAQGLADAKPGDFSGVKIEGAGNALYFPKLDADFSVTRLLEGFLGSLEWTKREARAVASRENGKRGGRPRKQVAAA
jgi:hypothetical protein